MAVLKDITTRIDSAVRDLTLTEVQTQGRMQIWAHASAQAGIDQSRMQVLGELGGVARKVDALLQLNAAGANP